MPAGHAEQTLREPPDHGGFISQAALVAEVETLAALDRDGIMPGHLLDALMAIAGRAPLPARAAVPVHADRHWGAWLPRAAGVIEARLAPRQDGGCSAVTGGGVAVGR